MSTVIHSNGSKWAGEAPDSIEVLLDVLGREALDPTFEEYGDFVTRREGGSVLFFGNFAKLSHVFQIDSDEPAIVAALTAAIRANQRRPDYVADRQYRRTAKAKWLLGERAKRRTCGAWDRGFRCTLRKDHPGEQHESWGIGTTAIHAWPSPYHMPRVVEASR